MKHVTVEKLYEDLRESLQLQLLAGGSCAEKSVSVSDVHRPGMALMGYTANFLPDRLQVMGESEMSFIQSLDPQEQEASFGRVMNLPAVACVVACDQEVPPAVLELCRREEFPLLGTPVHTVALITELTRYLDEEFAPTTDLHGTLVDVYGVGLLFTGRSGIGKSECALDLIERGHRLVADDVVETTRTADDILVGRHRELLRHNLEIRGVGVIDVQAIFGIRSIRVQKRIECEVQLQDWNDDVDYERLGLDRQTGSILGVDLPKVIVPLYPGKAITVIAETIALDFMLRIYGYDAAQVLNDRIMASMREQTHLRKYLRRDEE